MKTTRGSRLSRRAWLALGTLPLALAPFAAHAQQAQEEIVVTGTRIARPGITAPNPVTVLNSEAIALTGLQTTVDIMSQLPQAQNNLQPSNNNRFINGAGVAFTNLRGLGEYRTLTLVDGRRHVGSLSGRNGSGATSLVDTNVIAPGLIDRIEIVTGGASALYGADAVGGVVNFILKKNYEGAEITAQYGQSEHGDAQATTVNGLVGTNFGGKRGNITFAFDYNKDSGILAKDRDYAVCNRSLVPNPASFTGTDGIPNNISQACTRSSIFGPGGAPGVRTAVDANGPFAWTFSPDGTQAIRFNRGTLINPPGSRLGGAVGTTVAAGGEGENTAAQLQLRTPTLRIITNTLVNYEVANKVGPLETVNFFADVKYASSHANATNTGHANAGASPATNPFVKANDTASTALRINPDNPFIPLNFRPLVTGPFDINRSNYDWSSRNNRSEYEYFRAVAGFNGTFTNGWKYEAYYNYGRNTTTFTNIDRVEDRLRQQIDAINLNGQIVCRDPNARAAGCVPINPFRIGSLTPAQFAYAYTNTHENDLVTQKEAAVNVNGDLFTYATPFSGTVAPLSFATGYSWREEGGNAQPDFLAQSGQVFGNLNVPVVGKYTVREVYGELNVPVLRDLPFVKSLDVDAAYRYSDYSTSGSTNTWNVAVNYAINSDVKLRASTARAVRAPNIDELFSPFADNFIGITDPCSVTNINGGTNPANRRANCAALGIPATYNQNDFSNAPVRTGGNPNLKPEKARTWTAGVVLTPTFVPGLSVTVDYWFVKIRDGLQTFSQNAIIANCVDGPTLNQQFCSLVSRNPNGSLRFVTAQATNIGQESVRGVDVEANYSFDLDRVGLRNMGSLTFQGLMTWVPQNTQIAVPGDPTFNVYRSGVVGFPTLKGNLRTTWDYRDLTVSLNARYIGNGESFPNSRPLLPNGTLGNFEAADFNQVQPYWYFDLGARYRWNNLTFFGGINNVLNKEPPQVPFLNTGSNQTGAQLTNSATGDSASTYSNVGRFFYFGTTVKF